MRALAERLMAHETGGNQTSESSSPALFHVLEKLRPRLTTLVGNAGYRGLLSRALALAGAEVAWLRAVHVRSDGSLEGLDELHSKLTPASYFEGKVVLLDRLLGLLAAFIGETLTVQMLREVWPRLPLNGLDSGKGDKNAKRE